MAKSTFFAEFKKFITRGNVVDMSVGVIVGGAFTAIVNGMGNYILKPIVNWILALVFGADSLSGIYTYLKVVNKDILNEAGEVIGQEIDLAQSIYLDWGSLINAILNFFITALVLFVIVRFINHVRTENGELSEKSKMSRAQKKELRANGIKVKDKEAAAAYFAEKKRLAEEAAAAEAAAAEEAARLEREANPTTEDLLKLILAELKNQ